VARGTQHRKRRPAQNARSAAVAAQAQPRKQRPPQWQEQLFFQRLRLHAKWAYVLLAVAFAATFALLGVGSGSTGISDALQNFFSRNSGGTSISSLQHKAAKHPNNPQVWSDLATAYEQKHQTQNAIDALNRYVALRPKDSGTLDELAAEYQTLASDQYTAYANSAQQAQIANPAATFAPPATTPFGKIFASPTGLQDPIDQIVSAQASAAEQTAYQAYQGAVAQAEQTYKKVAKLTPTDVTAWYQLGQSAAAANDLKTAESAFKRFLKLAPNDVDAPTVRQDLKQVETQLKAQAAAAAPKKSASK
jgi:cytochrome c-type biogenesis protein CcmH/NrfG